MTISHKRIKTVILIIGMISIVGCGEKVQKTVYDTILASLSAEQSHAYVEISGSELPVLLVTGETYKLDNNIEAGIYCDVYYAWDENVEKLGRIESMGTAYPIKYKDEAIYAGGPQFVASYALNFEKQQLELVEYAEESFDEYGNSTYTYSALNTEEKVVDDDSFLMNMLESYDRATAVDFKK